MKSLYVRIPRLFEASIEGGYTRRKRPFLTWRRDGRRIEIWVGTLYVDGYVLPPP